MNNNNLSFTAVLYDGSLKEYKSGEDIRAYYNRAEVYKVFMNYNGASTELTLDEIFDTPKKHVRLVIR